ncbi:unnamed protein product [Aureobasidium pullulans]|nr:unnamed protein product [Aureobasidium pullulans]
MCGTPSIRINSHDHRYHSPPSNSRHSPHRSLHAPASPMAIQSRAQESPVPPALPPPRDVFTDDMTPQAQQKEWMFFNKEYVDQHWTDFGKAATVRPGSSLLGGNKAHQGSEGDDHTQHEIDASRRGSSMSTVTAPHRNSEAMIDPCEKTNQNSLAIGVLFCHFLHVTLVAYQSRSDQNLKHLPSGLVAHDAASQYTRAC